MYLLIRIVGVWSMRQDPHFHDSSGDVYCPRRYTRHHSDQTVGPSPHAIANTFLSNTCGS